MKKVFLIISGSLLLIGGVIGLLIAAEPQETKVEGMSMDECVDLVKSLENGDKSARESFVEALNSDSTWTLLDEIGDPSVDEKEEYMALDLNALLYGVASSQLSEEYENNRGNFVDGRDPDYDICLVEKCLAPGQEVVYPLTHRTGSEDVAVVEMRDDDLEVWLEGQNLQQDVKLQPVNRVFRGTGENVQIRLRNLRSETVSFVIINKH